jgi:hypothetical protein
MPDVILPNGKVLSNVSKDMTKLEVAQFAIKQGLATIDDFKKYNITAENIGIPIPYFSSSHDVTLYLREKGPFYTEIDSLAVQREALQGRSLQLDASVAGYERQLKTPQEMWGQVMWVALALLAVAYPLRFLVLGVRWSVKVLREG